MTTYVSGTLRLANGQGPHPLFISVDGAIQVDKATMPYQLEILGGHIMLRFPRGFQEEDHNVDELFRFARHIVDNAILSQIALEGVGLSYTLDYCRTRDGKVLILDPDRAPQIDGIALSFGDVLELTGSRAQLRYAIRDFNQGLIDREDCPFFFYRAIEILAKTITNKEELDAKDWNDFHGKIGTTRDDMKALEAVNAKHRHGTHSYFTKEEHLIMLRTVKYFMLKSLKHLLQTATHPREKAF